MDPGGEEYETDIGHTVTVVGFWDGVDGNNPFVGQGTGGTNPDALIVHNDLDSTLGGVPLPVVILFSVGEINTGLNVPWVMQTEISNVPEPATFFLAAFGSFVLLGYACRRRRTRPWH